MRRRTLGLTSTEANGGSAHNVETVGTKAISTPDASLALLAPTSISPEVDKVALLDLARLEADIACHLYVDSSFFSEGYLCSPIS